MTLPLMDNLTSDEVYDLYGHRLLEADIKSLYPYEDGNFCKEEYSGQDCMITYDPLTAYALRQKYPVKVWGKKYEKNRAFVFAMSRPKAILF